VKKPALLALVLVFVSGTAWASGTPDLVVHSRGRCESILYEEHGARLFGHVRAINRREDVVAIEVEWRYSRRYVADATPGSWKLIAWGSDGWHPESDSPQEFTSEFRSPFNEIEGFEFRLVALVRFVRIGEQDFRFRKLVETLDGRVGSDPDCKTVEDPYA
jgi:hypothetical protein